MNNQETTLRILPAGDRAVTIELGHSIDPAVNDQVQALCARLKAAQLPGVSELIPAFCSVLVLYDPDMLSFSALKERILSLTEESSSAKPVSRRLLFIPCCYGSHFGPDLADLSSFTGLSREEIIELHSQRDYRIYMLGFLPGFVYLGGLNERIAMPRLSVPRLKIPRGAVGIGGSQTGVYPLESPGGWRLIGSTPLDFYDPNRENPVLCRAGDFIRFIPITSCEYYDIRQELLRGTYRMKIELLPQKGESKCQSAS